MFSEIYSAVSVLFEWFSFDHSAVAIVCLLTIFHTSFIGKFLIILITEFYILTSCGQPSTEKRKFVHFCLIILHFKRKDQVNKVACFLKILPDTVSESCI